MRMEYYDYGVKLHIKGYELDFNKYFVGRLAASAVVAVSLAYSFQALGLDSCGKSASDAKSICSLYNYFDTDTCPVGYPSFADIRVSAFKNGTDALYDSISQSVSYENGWPMLEDEGIFRTICNNFPGYNQGVFPHCGH